MILFNKGQHYPLWFPNFADYLSMQGQKSGEGIEKAYLLCHDYLNEYPNNFRLKYQLAGLLPCYADKSGTSDENVKNAKERAVCLLKDAGKSDDSEIRNAALYLLACTYIQMDKSKEAQETLEQLPQHSFDPNYLLPTIYLQQKEYSKAIKLNQSNLLLSLCRCLRYVSGLSLIRFSRFSEE